MSHLNAPFIELLGENLISPRPMQEGGIPAHTIGIVRITLHRELVVCGGCFDILAHVAQESCVFEMNGCVSRVEFEGLLVESAEETRDK